MTFSPTIGTDLDTSTLRPKCPTQTNPVFIAFLLINFGKTASQTANPSSSAGGGWGGLGTYSLNCCKIPFFHATFDRVNNSFKSFQVGVSGQNKNSNFRISCWKRGKNALKMKLEKQLYIKTVGSASCQSKIRLKCYKPPAKQQLFP